MWKVCSGEVWRLAAAGGRTRWEKVRFCFCAPILLRVKNRSMCSGIFRTIFPLYAICQYTCKLARSSVWGRKVSLIYRVAQNRELFRSSQKRKKKYFQFFVFSSEHVCRCVVCFGRRSIERKFMSRRCRFHSNESRSFIIAAFRLIFFLCGASSLFVWYILSLCCWRVPSISWIDFFYDFPSSFFSMLPLLFLLCESENYQRKLCVIARVGSLRRNSRHNSNYRTKND